MIVPGSIIVIDDKKETAKRLLVDDLRNAGEKVLLYKENEEIPLFENLRLLIIDFNLLNHPSYQVESNSREVAKKINQVSERWRYFLTIVWTVSIEDDQDNGRKKEIKDKILEKLKDEFKNNFDENNLIVLPKLNSSQLIPALEDWISQNDNACLLFEWEKKIEQNKDIFFKQVYDSNLIQIVQNLKEQYGTEGATHELSQLFFRVLSRYINPVSEKFKEGIERIEHQQGQQEETPPTTIDANQPKEVNLDWYSNFFYLQSYFKPTTNSPMTGNIYVTEDESGFEYILVLNPGCDLIQRKTERIMYIKGCKIPKISQYQKNNENSMQEFIKHTAWSCYALQEGTLKKKYEARSDHLKKIFNSNMKERFYPLFYIKNDQKDGEYYHLLFDFYKIESIEVKIDDNFNYVKPEEWNLVCRLDYPIIEDIVHKFGTFCTRIGTPDVLSDYRKKEIELHKATNN